MAQASHLSGINIVSWIIGSGLLVFTANAIYSDFIKPPRLNIQVYDEGRQDSGIDAVASIYNEGLTNAQNITLRIIPTDLNITEYETRYFDENVENIQFDEEQDGSLVARIPRLASFSYVDIYTQLLSPYASNLDEYGRERIEYANSSDVSSGCLDPDSSRIGCYDVYAIYNEGSFYSLFDVTAYGFDWWGSRSHPLEQIVLQYFGMPLMPFLFILVLPSLIVIAFAAPKIFGKVRYANERRRMSKFVRDLGKEIIKIRKIVERDPLSKNIFPTEVWDSTPDTNRRIKSFDNYEYYGQACAFYNEVKKRDLQLSENQITDDVLAEKNQRCMLLANNTLDKINWKRYRSRLRRIIILGIVIAVFLLFLIFMSGAYPGQF